MATAKGGLTVAIKFTPQAVGDNISLYEDEISDGIQSLTNATNAAENILANDGGGAAAQIMAVIAGDKVADVKANLATYVDLANFSPPKAAYKKAVIDANSSIDLDDAGQVTFNSTNDYNSLAEGEPVEVATFTYIIRMGNGAFSVTTSKVWIVGQNDVAIAVADTGSMTEDSAPKTFNVLANDTKDADHTALNNVTIDSVTASGAPAGVTLANTDASASPTVDNEITVALTSAFQALREGEQATVTVAYTLHGDHAADDGHANLTVTVTGVNDDATIDGVHTGSVTEDGTTSANGNVQAHDVDHGQSMFQSVDNAALHGTYGDFTFDSSTGDWTYTLRNDDKNVQDLTSSDHVTDTLVVTSLDGTAHQDITVTINGANEPTTLSTFTLPTTYPGSPGEDAADVPETSGPPSSGTVTDNSKGSPVMYGTSGDDHINGNNEEDTIYGGPGNDKINGNNDNDTLYGGSGQDTIQGANDADTIVGGLDADMLTGNNGADKFVYTVLGDTNDTITDFLSGTDTIDLSAIDANGNMPTDQAFAWGGQKAAPGVDAYSINWFADGNGNVIVVGDTDGNTSTAEFQVTLLGIGSVTQNDFVL